jgi:hypothetical protein
LGIDKKIYRTCINLLRSSTCPRIPFGGSYLDIFHAPKGNSVIYRHTIRRIVPTPGRRTPTRKSGRWLDRIGSQFLLNEDSRYPEGRIPAFDDIRRRHPFIVRRLNPASENSLAHDGRITVFTLPRRGMREDIRAPLAATVRGDVKGMITHPHPPGLSLSPCKSGVCRGHACARRYAVSQLVVRMWFDHELPALTLLPTPYTAPSTKKTQ